MLLERVLIILCGFVRYAFSVTDLTCLDGTNGDHEGESRTCLGAQACFAITYYDMKGVHYHRGCCETDCEIFCESSPEIKAKNDDEGKHLLACDVCTENQCNSKFRNSKLTKKTVVTCYDCDNCPESPKNTKLCRSYSCCYTAQLLVDHGSASRVVRGCVTAKDYQDCPKQNLRDAALKEWRSMFANAKFTSFHPCERDEELCNNKQGYPLTYCYICSPDQQETCRVTHVAMPASKSDGLCCSGYKMLQDGVSYFRGMGECRKYSNKHKDLIECKECSSDRCNNQEFKATIKCYKCLNCKQPTPQDYSKSRVFPEMCYVAVLKKTVLKKTQTQVIRGIDRKDSTVPKYVKDILDTYDWKMVSLTPCGEDGLDGCNGQAVVPSIKCTSCEGEDCFVVDCYQLCCFTERYFGAYGFVDRKGCVVGDCEKYDGLPSNGMDKISVDVCYYDNCNEEAIEKFRCYACENCPKVDATTDVIECRAKECCYMIVYSQVEFGMWTVDRGCMEWTPGLQCSMELVRKRYKDMYPNIEIFQSSESCSVDDSLCNNKHNQLQTIPCYGCQGDECVDLEHLSADECETSCCFSFVGYGPHGLLNERGCARNFRSCGEDYCRYHGENFGGQVLTCVSCVGERCNDYPMKHPFLCYDCEGCYKVDATTDSVECMDSKCCYSAMMKFKNQTEMVVRGCLSDNCDVTTNMCNVVADKFKQDHPNGNIHCLICSKEGSLCNDDERKPPKKVMKCFQCNGEGCDGTSTFTSSVDCLQCCYSFAGFEEHGVTIERGCAQINCQKFVAEYNERFLKKHPSNEVMLHATCTDHLCNGNSLVAISLCYVCHDCNVIGEDTNVVACRCCYTAYLNVEGRQPLYAVRGCIEWSLGLKCNSSVARDHIESQFKLDHPRGVFDGFVSCIPDGEGLCNNETYVHPTISCYQCEGLTCAVANAGVTVECASSCCYRSTGFGPTGITYERGCADVPYRNHDYYREQFAKRRPEGELMSFEPCFESLCNKEALQAKISCYQCDEGCSIISTTTKIVECKGFECCYVARVRTKKHQPLSVIRGCIEMPSGQPCQESNTEDRVKYDFEVQHPDGVFEAFNTCKELDTNICNNETVDQPSIDCYECPPNDCATVDKTTETIKCYNMRCYSFTGFTSDGVVNKRGCAHDNREDYCGNYYIGEFLKRNPRTGKVITCEDCATDRCNHRKLQHKIMCYQCEDCNTISSSTVQIECAAKECCYDALVSRKKYQPFYKIRGCIRLELGCSKEITCQEVETDFKRVYTEGVFGSCEVCNDGNLQPCNSKLYVPPSIKCNVCEGDGCVSYPVVDETCSTMCCYSLIAYSEDGVINKRGCAHEMRNCTDYCNHYTKLFPRTTPGAEVISCESCNDEDKCNKDAPRNRFYCYSCEECDEVTAATNVTECLGAECCYTAYFRPSKYHPQYITRGCIVWTLGLTCSKPTTCQQVNATLTMQHPDGELVNCETCDPSQGESNCNNAAYKRPKIECYQYDDTDANSVDLNTKIDCYNMCCYSWTIYTSQGVRNKRDCAADMKPCQKYCENFKSTNTTIDVLNCENCATTGCNNMVLQTKFLCYSCKNCNELIPTPDTTECKCPECCYTVFLSDHQYEPLHVERGCMDWTRGLKCDKGATCDSVQQRYMHSHPETTETPACYTCNPGDASLCNSDQLPSIKCYKCDGAACRSVPQTTVPCPQLCCYTASGYGANGAWYERDCASDKRPCGSMMCEEYQRRFPKHLTFTSCNACEYDNCNNETLEEFGCYQCDNCNEVIGLNATQCLGPECCYTAYSHHEKFQPLYASRGCVAWTLGLRCTEKTVNEYARAKFPEGNFGGLVRCDANDRTGCNDASYTPRSIDCYECNEGDCGILENTTTTPCNHLCCFSVTLFMDGGVVNKRGCAGDMQPCETYCNRYQYDISNTEVLYCKPCSNNRCNNEVLQKKFECYSCSDCNRVKVNTSSKECVSPLCCYTAHIRRNNDGPSYAIRDCLSWSPGMRCKRTCNTLKDTWGDRLENCTTCEEFDSSNCNNREYLPQRTYHHQTFRMPYLLDEPIRCYTCTNCTKVTTVTPNIPCRMATCCYTALLLNSNGEEFYTVRGCADWGKDCATTCSDVATLHLEAHQNGTVKTCTTCLQNDGHECNNHTHQIDTPQIGRNITCYACAAGDDCAVVTPLTSTVECPNSGCCYMALLKIHATSPLVVVRGCARMRNQQICANTCNYLERNHHRSHPHGVFRVCIQCSDEDGDNCNGRRFEAYLLRDPGMVSCYDCRKCSRVTTRTHRVLCRDASCCYAVYVKDHVHSEYYVIRGCWKGGRRCLDTCQDVETDYMWVHPFGRFAKCTPCPPNSKDRCNSQSFQIHTTATVATLINCYSCGNCHRVNHNTPTRLCEAACCYTAILRDSSETVEYVSRGCATVGESCKSACQHVQHDQLWDYPLGFVISCTTCGENESDQCNNRPFRRPKKIPARFNIRCYKCNPCNQVTSATQTINCKSPKCCYTMFATNSTDGVVYGSRGCANVAKCETTCSRLSKSHLLKHPYGTFDYCMTCHMDAKSFCNNYYYKPPPSTKVGVVRCYNCSDCDEVVKGTKRLQCAPTRCYVAFIRTEHGGVKTERGCGKSDTNTCKLLRKYRDVQFCRTCGKFGTDNCNQKNYHPHQIASRFECYNCVGCATRGVFKQLTTPCPDECCLVTTWTEYGLTLGARLCAKLDGGTCKHYCNHLRAIVSNYDPHGSVQNCSFCTTTKCNNDETIIKSSHLITCYACKDCPTITEDTPTRSCSTRCCYSVLTSSSTTVRGCAAIRPGRPCRQYCRHIHNCLTCSTPNCNTKPYKSLKPITCFNCVGCYDYYTDPQTTSCATRCCYTIHWTERSSTNIVRGCASQATTCENHCHQMTKLVDNSDPTGKVHKCEICTTNKCNHLKVLLLEREPTHESILCHNCTNCDQAGHSVTCHSSCCCASSFRLADGSKVSRRECAVILPGRVCAAYCDFIRIAADGEVDYCKCCEQDECNSEHLN